MVENYLISHYFEKSRENTLFDSHTNKGILRRELANILEKYFYSAAEGPALSSNAVCSKCSSWWVGGNLPPSLKWCPEPQRVIVLLPHILPNLTSASAPPPCHLLHSGRAVGKKPSFFSCCNKSRLLSPTWPTWPYHSSFFSNHHRLLMLRRRCFPTSKLRPKEQKCYTWLYILKGEINL